MAFLPTEMRAYCSQRLLLSHSFSFSLPLYFFSPSFILWDTHGISLVLLPYCDKWAHLHQGACMCLWVSAQSYICAHVNSMVKVVRWPDLLCEALGIITETDYRSCSQDFMFHFFPCILRLLHSLLHQMCFFFPFSHTKGRARCWCFITLTEAEWCYIIKSLLKGRGLSIITAAAFMFSLASASLRCHRWPFVPYQRRLWSSGSSVPDTYDTD